MPASLRVKRKTFLTLPKRLPNAASVAYGFPEQNTSAEIRQIAAWQEFGTKNIPERPFVREGVKPRKYRSIMKQNAAKVLRGKIKTKTVLTRIGKMGADDVRLSLLAWSTPGNAPSTIAKKGFDDPLIDTGKMYDEINYYVDERG